VHGHPYRQSGNEPEPEPEPPAGKLPGDDLALALIVGALGVVLGASAERVSELAIGLVLIGLASFIVTAARRAGGW
jgi:hypothetical protein